MNRRQVLGGLGALVAGLGWRARPARAAEEHFLIVHWNTGGWDPSYVFDPRIGSSVVDTDPDAVLAEEHGLSFADAASRPAVRRFFEDHGHRAAVINGLAVGSISHASCTRLMLTGSRRADAADLPTLLAAGTGSALALPHVVLSGPRYPGTLGEVMVPLSETLVGTVDGSLPDARSFDPAAEARARAWLQATAEGLAEAENGHAELYRQYARGLDRRERLEGTTDALSVGTDPTALERLEAGLAALSGGLSRCLIVEGSLPERVQWDSHQSNHLAQDGCFENLFDELSTLAEALEAAQLPSGKSLAERTTVVVLSEMGRTPVLNASNGKDHWPFTSALVFGAGVRGGQVVGATDEVLVSEPVDPGSGEAHASGEILTPAHLIAGVLEAAGVDPGEYLPDVTPLSAPFQPV